MKVVCNPVTGQIAMKPENGSAGKVVYELMQCGKLIELEITNEGLIDLIKTGCMMYDNGNIVEKPVFVDEEMETPPWE